MAKRSRQKFVIFNAMVQFKYTGSEKVAQCNKVDDLLCSECAVARKKVEPFGNYRDCSKLHDLYTHCNEPSTFGGKNGLERCQSAVKLTKVEQS